jgi:hypothetical protein
MNRQTKCETKCRLIDGRYHDQRQKLADRMSKELRHFIVLIHKWGPNKLASDRVLRLLNRLEKINGISVDRTYRKPRA